MRTGFLAFGLATSFLIGASETAAEPPRRMGPEASPIATSVSPPPGSRLVYFSGTVPDAINLPETLALATDLECKLYPAGS